MRRHAPYLLPDVGFLMRAIFMNDKLPCPAPAGFIDQLKAAVEYGESPVNSSAV